MPAATDAKKADDKAKAKAKKKPLLNQKDKAWIRHQEITFEKRVVKDAETRKLYTPDIWKTRIRVLARSEWGTDDISGVVDSLTWQDHSTDDLHNVNTQAAMIGTLTYRKPNLRDYPHIAPLVFPKKESYNARVGSGGVGPGVAAQGALGGVIICQIGYGKTWTNLWAMRVVPGPDQGIGDQITLSDGTRTLNLADDLWLMGQTVADFKYTKGKKIRKQGWRCDQIALDVCQRYRIPVRRLAQGTAFFALSNAQTQLRSPLYVIAQAYQHETNHTGRTFIIRWGPPGKDHPMGALEITPMRRNRLIYQLREQLIEATLTRNMATDFANVLEARGTLKSQPKPKDDDDKKDAKKKKTTTKVTYVAMDRSSTKRFGWIRKTVNFGTVASHQELEVLAKRSLAVRLTPIRTAEISHPGIATVRRGDAIRLNIPEEGYARQRIHAYQQMGKGKQNKQFAAALRAAEKSDPALFDLGIANRYKAQRGSTDTTVTTGSKRDANVPEILPVADQGLVFVTSVVHTVSAGSYEMDATFGFINVLEPSDVRAQVDESVRRYKTKAKKAANKRAEAAKKKAEEAKKKADDAKKNGN